MLRGPIKEEINEEFDFGIGIEDILSSDLRIFFTASGVNRLTPLIVRFFLSGTPIASFWTDSA